MKLQHIPNIITSVRLFLIIPLCMTLLSEHYISAFFIFMLAGISDGLDGFLARTYGWQSKLGAIIDPLADKLLMLMTYATLTWLSIVPIWLFLLVIGRDLIIILGALLYKFLVEEPYYQASWYSKINTAMQIFFAVLVLFNTAFVAIPAMFVHVCMYVVAITTLISLIDYVIVWANRAFKIWKYKSS